MVRAGMTPLQVIQAATVNGAELLGLTVDLGTLERIGADRSLDRLAKPVSRRQSLRGVGQDRSLTRC
jgi:hypothetical protein